MLTAGSFSACSEFLDPEIDKTLDEDRVFENAAYFCGPLMESYNNIPNHFDYQMDVMTDNAVKNNLSGDYYLCGIGALRPNHNPLNNWTDCYWNIRLVNTFLSKMILDPESEIQTPVRFYPIEDDTDRADNLATFYRLRGEAFFLRAWWLASALRNFGGEGVDGKILGVPLVGDKILTTNDDLNIPRASYEECVKAIVADCDSAINLLPVEYKGSDRVIGKSQNGRANGIAAMALKARVLLYAASPAFNKPYDATKWETAAKAAGDAIQAIGGIGSAMSTYDQYYFDKLNNKDYQNRDIFMRSSISSGNQKFESENYPKSMYGSANVGVSQNFVDVFPDKDGYPIGESGLYDEDDPYTDRDPRLAMYVGYNGAQKGPDKYTLQCYQGGQDAYNPLRATSRSSYYLFKLTKSSVRLTPGSETKTSRANIILGLPELYLNFAEAAAKAWGVSGDPQGYGFNAKSVLSKVITRFGGGVAYLNTVVGEDADLFDAYVRIQRRIELAFEGHYYYDLRRWIGDKSTTTLNVPVYGIKIVQNNGTTTYQKVELEKREFISPFQPLPYDELFNAPALIQNYGWK